MPLHVNKLDVSKNITDDQEIKDLINSYFNFRYTVLSTLTIGDLSYLLSTSNEAQIFLDTEIGKLTIEVKNAEKNQLRYYSYDYSLDFDEIIYDEISQTATAIVIEGNQVIYEISHQASPTDPIVSSLSNLKHTIKLHKEQGEWKIVSDYYDDLLWRLIRETNSPIREIILSMEEPKIQTIEGYGIQASVACQLPPDTSSYQYNRIDAVEYALTYALTPNTPKYDNYDGEILGGDCTNFVSQAIHEGGGASMVYLSSVNQTCNEADNNGYGCVGTAGWYYTDPFHRAAAWNEVSFLHTFIVNEASFWPEGPEGCEVPQNQVELGDLIQYYKGSIWAHSVIIVDIVNGVPYVASHSPFFSNQPFTIIPDYTDVRFIHIERIDGNPPVTPTPTATLTPASTATFAPSPTITPIYATPLTFAGWNSGCTATPYISCSSEINATQTNPSRIDIEVTYNYGDNSTFFGSNFSVNLDFATNVYQTQVPIYWEMYPVINSVMPPQKIQVQFSGVEDLSSVSMPTGSWFIPAQPHPYDGFSFNFSRLTTGEEILSRTDKWHVTVATYDFINQPPYTPNPPIPTSTPFPTACTSDCFWEQCYSTSGNISKLASLSNAYSFIIGNFDRISDQAALLYRVRDEILGNSTEGQRYIDVYYQHSAEIASIMNSHPNIAEQGLDFIDSFTPNLQALLDGQGNTVVITNAQVQEAEAFLDAILPYASNALQQTIAIERLQQPLEQFIGVSMDEALEYVEDGVSATPTSTITPTLTATPTFTPSPTSTPASGLLFADSFESGNFSAWGWATTDGGDLSVSTQSSAVGTYGMQALLDDSAEILVYDHTPNNETHYSARFYFDPNDVQSPNDGFYLTALTSSGAGWVACLLFEPQGNDYYSLNLCGKNDAGNWLETEAVLIADEWQAIELEWKAATSSGANNGYFKLYIGDQLAASIENIDNDTHSITTTSLGVLDTPTGASGIMYFDEFESRTSGYIGLHPSAPAVNPAPSRPDALFSDNFEGNNLNAWNPTLTKIDFGDLFTSSGSAYQSDYGLEALIDDTVVLKAIDSSPADESQYRARFYFNPNSLTMNNNTAHYIFDGYDTDADDYLFRLELLHENGSYKLRPRIMKDNYATTNGSKYTISNAWHSIEIEWKKATAVGANNGYLSLWIDGTLVGTISNVDNDLWTLDFVQLGATASVDSTTSGSMLFDNFISKRYSYIGQ